MAGSVKHRRLEPCFDLGQVLDQITQLAPDFGFELRKFVCGARVL
jgi:hypothetical protein